jgi:hypothetical protein
MIPQAQSAERQPSVLNLLGLSGSECRMRIVGARGRVPDTGARPRAPTRSCKGSGGFVSI